MKHLDRLICFTAVQLIVTGLSILVTSGARAELRPVFDELKLFNSAATMPTIEVEAEGKDWVAVSTEILHVTTNYYVSLKRGDIVTISARYADSAITKSRHPGGGKRRWGEFAFEIPKSEMGVLTHFAIDACNQKKKSGARTDEVQTAFVQLPFKLFVRAERFSNQSSKTVDGSVQAKVVCKKAPKQLEISHLDVEVADTNSCPKTAIVNVGFQTNRGDRINFTLEHMNRGLQSTSRSRSKSMVNTLQRSE